MSGAFLKKLGTGGLNDLANCPLGFEGNGNENDRIAFRAISGMIGREQAQREAVSFANTGKRYALGCKRSEKTKRTISEAKRGKQSGPGYIRTNEQRLHTSLVMNGNKNGVGSKRTKEYKKHLSDYKRGRRQSLLVCPCCGKSGGNTMGDGILRIVNRVYYD